MSLDRTLPPLLRPLEAFEILRPERLEMKNGMQLNVIRAGSQEVVRLEEKTAGIKREVDDLSRRLYEEYELTRMEAEAIAKPIENAAEANRRVTGLRNKIRNLGSVNVDAIEEFKEVNERYQFLKVQIDDVEKTKEELLKQINELTVQMREVFIERFKQINYQYGIVFAELFGGGKGAVRDIVEQVLRSQDEWAKDREGVLGAASR